MKIASAAILSIAALVGSIASAGVYASASSCKRTNGAAFVWSQCAGGTVWIVETARPLVSFHIEGIVPPLKQQATADSGFALVFNGAYHDGNYAQAKVEGLHVLEGRKISELKANDAQLTHVLSINRDGKISTIREANSIDESVHAVSSDSSYSRIQSGPLILDDGKFADRFVAGSLNGSDAYKRTALGRTRAGETVIVIAKTPYTLAELAAIVSNANDYAKRGLTLVNLDGGPSTAIYSPSVRGLSYGAGKITPVGFGVRK